MSHPQQPDLERATHATEHLRALCLAHLRPELDADQLAIRDELLRLIAQAASRVGLRVGERQLRSNVFGLASAAEAIYKSRENGISEPAADVVKA